MSSGEFFPNYSQIPLGPGLQIQRLIILVPESLSADVDFKIFLLFKSQSEKFLLLQKSASP
jgi:hypothetical protein